MLEKISQFLFPTTCLGCDEPGAYLCRDCKKELQPHQELCPFCHRVSPHRQTCLNCRKLYPTTVGIIIGFQYTGILRQLIWKLKYDHRRQIAPFLAERLALLVQTQPHISQALQQQKLVISRVPSHRRRKWFVKGYNQSHLLATALADYLQVPAIPVVKKIKHTRSQTKLSRQQRLHNLINSFAMLAIPDLLPDDTTLLVVDDITTTGSTLDEVTKTIHTHASHIQIRGLVAGRHGK